MILAVLVEEEKRARQELIDERAQLSKMSQKLIEAHEEERTRIGRELHDDINQQIALLAVRLDGLHLCPISSPLLGTFRRAATSRQTEKFLSGLGRVDRDNCDS